MEENELMKRFFDERAAGWDTRGHADNAPALRAMLRAGGIREGSRVLDIACGTGVLFPLLLESSPELVHGIDLSPEMANLARAKATDPRISVFAADFYTYAPDAPYDFAVAYNAYPHFTDKTRFAQKLRALVKTGGRFLILHGGGRERINAHHNRCEAAQFSVPLLSCEEEALHFEELFRIDMSIDTENCYALSGAAI